MGRNPAAAHRGTGPEQLLVNTADVIGVLTKQPVGDLFRVGVLGWSAGSFGVTEADASVAGLGGDLGDNRTISVIGFCRPVSTLASLIGVSRGSVTVDSLTWRMRSVVTSPPDTGASGLPMAVSAVMPPSSLCAAEMQDAIGFHIATSRYLRALRGSPN